MSCTLLLHGHFLHNDSGSGQEFFGCQQLIFIDILIEPSFVIPASSVYTVLPG